MRPRAAGASRQDANTELPERARPSRAVARNLMPNHGVRPGEPNGRDNAWSADRAALRRNSYSGRDQRRPEHLSWLGKKGREHASAGKTIRSPRERRLDTGGHKNGPHTLCTGGVSQLSLSFSVAQWRIRTPAAWDKIVGANKWGTAPNLATPHYKLSFSRGHGLASDTRGKGGSKATGKTNRKFTGPTPVSVSPPIGPCRSSCFVHPKSRQGIPDTSPGQRPHSARAPNQSHSKRNKKEVPPAPRAGHCPADRLRELANPGCAPRS